MASSFRELESERDRLRKREIQLIKLWTCYILCMLFLCVVQCVVGVWPDLSLQYIAWRHGVHGRVMILVCHDRRRRMAAS